MKALSAVEVGTALIQMEISKDNILSVEIVLQKTKMLCERLINGKMKKPRLDDWEKDAVAGHKKMITQCDITLKMLKNLKPVLIIELESESLPPPSAPDSVAETETICCDHCLEETTNPVKFGDETICVVCNNQIEALEAKKKFEAEEKERKDAIQRKLDKVAELQAKKDKRSTEMSLANKQTLADLKEQVQLLESIGYHNLDQKGKQSLTRFKHRISDLEADSCSSVSK